MVTYQLTKIIKLDSYLNVCASKDEFFGIFVFTVKTKVKLNSKPNPNPNYLKFLGQKMLNCTH